MTRKRFVKLLMAEGCSRNLAQARAIIARSAYGSYASAYERDFPSYVARKAIRDMTALLRSAWEAVQPMIRHAARNIASVLSVIEGSSEVAHE